MTVNITNFLLAQKDCLQFFFGVFFIYLVAVSLTLHQERKSEEVFPWIWIVVFGVFQIIYQWGTMLLSLFPLGGAFEFFRGMALVASYLSLCVFTSIYFSKKGKNSYFSWKIGFFIFLFSFVLLILGKLNVFYFCLRYFLGLPVSLFMAFIISGEADKKGGETGSVLRIASAGIIVYGLLLIVEMPPLSFFPVNLLNYEAFARIFVFPVQIFQGAGILAFTTALWRYLDLKQRGSGKINESSQRIRFLMVWLMGFILIGGFLLTMVLSNYSRGIVVSENRAYLEAIKQNLNDEFGDSDGIAKSLSGSPYIIGALAKKTSFSLALANSALDRYNKAFEKGACYLIDINGNTIASSNRDAPDSFVGKNYSFRPYFKDAISGKSGRFIGKGLTSGVFGYYSAFPVFVNGKIAGVVAVKVELDKKILGSGHLLVLSNKQGDKLISNLDFERFFSGKTINWLKEKKEVHSHVYKGKRFFHLDTPFAEGEWDLNLLFSDELVSYFKIFARAITLLFILMFMTGNYFIRKFELVGIKISEDERRYRALFEKSAEGIFLLSINDARIIEANLAGAQMHGCSVEEIKKYKMTDFDTEENKEKAPARLDLMNEGDWLGGEIYHKKKDGTLFPVEWLAGPVAISGEKYVLAFIRDITERKKATDALLESEKKFKEYVEASPIAIFIADKNGKYTYVNNSASIMLGYSEEEFLNLSIPQITAPYDLEKAGKSFLDLQKGIQVKMDISLKHKRGEEVPVVLTATKISDNVFIAYCLDVTEIHKKEKELKESQEKMESLLKSMQDLVFVLDDNLVFQSYHQSPKDTLLTPPENFIGKRFDAVGLPERAVADIKLALEKTLKTGELSSVEYFLDLPQGRSWFDLNATPYSLKDGKISGVTCVVRDITERKNTEQSLLESEEKFKAIASTAQDGIILADSDDNVVFWNDSAREIFGYSFEEITSKKFHYFIMPQMNEASYKGHMGQFKETGSTFVTGHTHELMAKRKNGDIFPIDLSVSSINLSGKWFAVGIVRDITERKKYEKEILKLANIIKYSDDAIFSKDLSGNITSWNKGSENMYGYTEEEIMGKNVKILALEEDYKQVDEIIEKIKRGEHIEHFEAKRVKKGGEVIDVSLYISPIKDPEGNIIGASSIVRDITEEKRVREEVNELFKAVEQAPVSIVITDMDGKIEYTNPFFEKVSGYTAEEAKGQNPKILKSGETSIDDYKNLWDTIKSGKTWEGEFHNKRKDGSLYWERASISPIFDKDGKIIKFIGVKENITERKEFEQALIAKNKELERLYKIKSDFTSMVSHELRTPLTAIKEGISIVYDGTAGDIKEEQKEFLDIAKRNVDRLHRLINDVLDFSKIEAGKIEFKMLPNDLSQVLKEAVSMQKKIAEDKNLYLNLDIKTEIPKQVFDYDKIMQVLSNIINNAIKFTEKGGIDVYAERDSSGKNINVCVHDTGIGISKEDMPKIFQKFSQVGNINERRTGGTGLGLAISKQIVEAHSGKIWIESEPGKGSTFCFSVPV